MTLLSSKEVLGAGSLTVTLRVPVFVLSKTDVAVITILEDVSSSAI